MNKSKNADKKEITEIKTIIIKKKIILMTSKIMIKLI